MLNKLLSAFPGFRSSPAETTVRPRAAVGEASAFFGLDDPRFLEWIRGGGEDGISVRMAMKNTAVARCVSLISYSTAMLPLHLIDKESKEKAVDHPVFHLLHRRPNDWQTSFNWRQLMQRRILLDGNGYSFIIRSRGKILRLVPLTNVTPRQRDDWTVEYVYQLPRGGQRILQPDEVLHIYGDSENGISGTSLVAQAGNAIRLALQAELAGLKLFEQGALAGGILKLREGKELSEPAYERLKRNLDERYSGVENAGKWIIGEDGMDAKELSASARDSQHDELRQRQVEEIARVFGVPRPLLMVDETSWGSGIDALGQFFVRYGLQPWFTAWEQRLEQSLLTDAEREKYEIKFNFGALIRGSLKDQGEYFAKALGSGGHDAWMQRDEIRELLDLGPLLEVEPEAQPQFQPEGNNSENQGDPAL